MKNFLTILMSSLLCVFAASCSNYRLAGTPIDLPFASVYVKPVRNVSYAPQASNLLTNSIVNALNQVPDLRTTYETDAQAVLETRILEYKKVPVATSSSDTALAASYKMIVIAECTLTRSNGEVIFKNRKVRAETSLYTGDSSNPALPTTNNLINNEYQNMPVLMRELGNRIKDAAIGIW